MTYEIQIFKAQGAPKLIDAESPEFASILSRIVHSRGAKVIYVYSPMCGHCQAGAPLYVEALKSLPKDLRSRFYRFNATPSDAIMQSASETFHKITGAQITYYPMVLGISTQGRLVVFNGPVNASTLEPFLLGLEQT
jgi:hypothetical protein